MNTKSIRFRLAALYSIVLFVTIAVLFGAFSFITQRELYRHTDILLRSHAKTIQKIVEKSDENFQQTSSSVFHKEAEEIPGMVIAIVDTNNYPVYLSPNLGQAQNISQLLAMSAQTGSERFENNTAGTQAMRFIILPLTRDQKNIGSVMVGHPIDVIRNSLANVYGILIALSLGLIIPGIVVGYMLAGRALAPVVLLRDQIERIHDDNLTRQIPSPDTHDELEQLTAAFNNLLERLDTTFRRERQFIADVAHELKTPVATCRTSIDVALSKARSVADYKLFIQTISIDIDRLAKTLTNLLDIAWSQTDVSQHKLTTIHISTMLEELMEIASTMAEEKQITIEQHIEPAMAITGKQDAVFRALLNIIENAIKYTHSKGTVTIRAEKRNGGVVISIKDTGRGISKADLPHIFKRYYRGSKTDKTLGSGLGLSISHAIISAHGGDITVQSARGRGTAFYVYLPQAPQGNVSS